MRYCVWLQLCIGQGSKAIGKMSDKALTAKDIYSLDVSQIERMNIFTKGELKRIDKSKIEEAEKILAICKNENIDIITFEDARYPQMLREICDPPLVLYIKGEFPDFDNTPAISIVGPRKVSEFGKKAAYSLGYRFAKSGMLVISGGAVGSDSYAHIGALKSGGKTVLVMPCGFRVGYLEENRALRSHIENHGCLITEYPPDKAIERFTFQVRNRLISALSLGTVVIEAGVRSGALITANHAIEQGKDVFVIPGSPGESHYKGSNALLRDGAKPLLDASDIFNEYIALFPDKIDIEKAYKKEINTAVAKKNKKIFNETLSKEAKIVYNCLDTQKFYPDELDSGLSSNQLLAALTELEMEFIIRALPGGQYEICN